MVKAGHRGRSPSLQLQLSLVAVVSDELSLWRHPISTVVHFLQAASECAGWCCSTILTNWTILPIVFSALLGILCVVFSLQPSTALFNGIWSDVSAGTWWIGLGILSSLGLGSGFPSGVLFLLPNLYFITTSAEKCKALNFDWRVNSWAGRMQRGQSFECDSASTTISTLLWSAPSVLIPNFILNNHLHDYFCLVVYALPSFLLWGAGTVIGELPPYLAAYAASKARSARAEDFHRVQEAIHDAHSKSFITRQKQRIRRIAMHVVMRYGVFAVFALSSWPNAFFDICGIVCGYYLMPLWKFLPALWLGKGVVKVTLQCLVLTFLASEFGQLQVHAIRGLCSIPLITGFVERRFGSLDDIEAVMASSIGRLRHDDDIATGFSLRLQPIFDWAVLVCSFYLAVRFIEHIATVHFTQENQGVAIGRKAGISGRTASTQKTQQPAESPTVDSRTIKTATDAGSSNTRRAKRAVAGVTTESAAMNSSDVDSNATPVRRGGGKRLMRARSASPGETAEARQQLISLVAQTPDGKFHEPFMTSAAVAGVRRSARIRQLKGETNK